GERLRVQPAKHRAVAFEAHARPREPGPPGEHRQYEPDRTADDRIGPIRPARVDAHLPVADMDRQRLLTGTHLEGLRRPRRGVIAEELLERKGEPVALERRIRGDLCEERCAPPAD